MDEHKHMYMNRWYGHQRPIGTAWCQLGRLTVICFFVAILLTSCGSTDTPQASSGHLLIVGSTAMQPLVTAAAALFEKANPRVQVEVRGGGSLSGLSALVNQEADIADSDVYADPAIYPDPSLTDHIICVIPFALVVAPDIPVLSLTHQQVIDIFSTGKIRNWKEVNGPNLPIVPIVRPTTSGTRAVFRKYVLGGRDERGTLLTTDSSTDIRDTVAHTPGAIGYLALSVLSPSVRAIAIDGQMATREGIESGHYPFWAYEHMYTLGIHPGSLSTYLSFMQTAPVQQLEPRLGYIPTVNMKFSSAGSSHSKTSLSNTLVFHESEATLREFF